MHHFYTVEPDRNSLHWGLYKVYDLYVYLFSVENEKYFEHIEWKP